MGVERGRHEVDGDVTWDPLDMGFKLLGQGSVERVRGERSRIVAFEDISAYISRDDLRSSE